MLFRSLLKLRSYGIIDSKLKPKHLMNRGGSDEKNIVFFSNEKTKLCISLFFNDNEYLYNCCLDCEIPENIDYHYHIISETEKSYYAPSVIKTSISFIQYLLFLDREELRDMKPEYKIFFGLTSLIKMDDLLTSFGSALNLVFQDPDYIEDLKNYFN